MNDKKVNVQAEGQPVQGLWGRYEYMVSLFQKQKVMHGLEAK